MKTYTITSKFDGDVNAEDNIETCGDVRDAAMLGAMRWIEEAIRNGMDAPLRTSFEIINMNGGRARARVTCDHMLSHGGLMTDTSIIEAAPQVK